MIDLESIHREIADLARSSRGVSADPLIDRLMPLIEGAESEVDRIYLASSLVTNLSIAGFPEESHRFALTFVEMFDAVISWRNLSQACERIGDLAGAVEPVQIAFAKAIERRELINDTFGFLMRALLKASRPPEELNAALKSRLAASPRSPDCQPETDWVNEANRAGADRDLLVRYLELAGYEVDDSDR